MAIPKKATSSHSMLHRRLHRPGLVVRRFTRLDIQWEISNRGDEVFDVGANALDRSIYLYASFVDDTRDDLWGFDECDEYL
mmetsp:Transcript_9183/g.14836  ORF Transcript_9183/g.14836 Transcript_9183/m.14836 type:complete len:81 (+) Transcript_9183:183-425(+)